MGTGGSPSLQPLVKCSFRRSFGRRLSQRATRLAAVFIRTSYTISRGCLTLRNFSIHRAEKTVSMFNSLTQDCIPGLFLLYLLKLSQGKHNRRVLKPLFT